MSSDSLEPQVSRPAVDAVVQDGRAPGQDASPPEPGDARLKAALFSQPDAEKPPSSIFGLAAAGMLLHDLMQGCSQTRADEDEEEEKPRKDSDPAP